MESHREQHCGEATSSGAFWRRQVEEVEEGMVIVKRSKWRAGEEGLEVQAEGLGIIRGQ